MDCCRWVQIRASLRTHTYSIRFRNQTQLTGRVSSSAIFAHRSIKTSMTVIIETKRLILSTWKESDAEPYFQINQDPKVIEYLRGPLTMEQV